MIERALGVPVKRFERPMFGYLTREEMLAVIGKPGDSWLSQRDHALFLLMYNTGARVSEIIGIKVGDVVLDASAACVHLHGKGRKQRSVPLWRSTVKALRAWLHVNPQFDGASPLLPNRAGRNDPCQRHAQVGISGPARDGISACTGQRGKSRRIRSATRRPCICFGLVAKPVTRINTSKLIWQ